MILIADYTMQQYNRLKVLGCLLVLAVLMSEGSEFKARGPAKENNFVTQRQTSSWCVIILYMYLSGVIASLLMLVFKVATPAAGERR